MTVWWEGLDKNPPENATEWKGAKVNGKEYSAEGNKLAHPNSRFTAPAKNCPCISPEFDNPKGVPISAIISAADVRLLLRWYISRLTGSTVPISARRFHQKRLLPQPAR